MEASGFGLGLVRLSVDEKGNIGVVLVMDPGMRRMGNAGPEDTITLAQDLHPKQTARLIQWLGEALTLRPELYEPGPVHVHTIE